MLRELVNLLLIVRSKSGAGRSMRAAACLVWYSVLPEYWKPVPSFDRSPCWAGSGSRSLQPLRISTHVTSQSIKFKKVLILQSKSLTIKICQVGRKATCQTMQSFWRVMTHLAAHLAAHLAHPIVPPCTKCACVFCTVIHVICSGVTRGRSGGPPRVTPLRGWLKLFWPNLERTLNKRCMSEGGSGEETDAKEVIYA